MIRIDSRHGGLRKALLERRELIGTFVKTNSYQITEILGLCDFDFLALDAEHGPLGIESLDVCCLAAKATNATALVRVPNLATDTIMRVLDVGAAGIIAPHVDNAEIAGRLVASTRYQAKGSLRGYSNSPRAGSYGRLPMQQHIAASDSSVSVIAQIESRTAVESIHEITEVAGIDCLLIGRADLAVSYGYSDLDHPEIEAAVRTIAAAAHKKSVSLGIFLSNPTDMDRFRKMGFTMFIIGSDQSHLAAACNDFLKTCRGV